MRNWKFCRIPKFLFKWSKKPEPLKPNVMQQQAKKLYALCVGINDYQYVGKLRGCVPDANNMLDYLKSSVEDTDYELDAVLLTDAQATKENICNTFLTHLTKAGPEDTALFYFSGHGAEEQADKIWHKADGSGLLTTVVCYDSRNGKVPDLADKEIRYMISKVAEKDPHFVLIMDSCHSGGSTRSTEKVSDEMVPRLTGHSAGREWGKFVFAKEHPYDKVKDIPVKQWLPEGKHIHFGSCNDRELAYEVRGSGVFTSTLLDILGRSAGKVTYDNLLSRIRNFVKGRYPQTPQFYVYKQGREEAQKQYFLGGAASSKPPKANVLRNRRLNNWLVDQGAMHGLQPTITNENMLVDIYDHADKLLGSAKVKSTQPAIAYLDTTGIDLDEKETYGARIRGIYKNPIKVFIKGDDVSVKALQSYLQLDAKEEDDLGDPFIGTKLDVLSTVGIEFTNEETTCDYCVTGEELVYQITLPFSELVLVQQQPRFGKKTYIDKTEKSIASEVDKALGKLIIQLRQIANYEFTKKIANPTTKLRPKPPITLEFFNEGDFNQPIIPVDDELDLTGVDEFTLRLKNNSRRKLYVSLLYMTNLFGVNNDLIGKVITLEADQEDWAFEGDLVPIGTSEFIDKLNYPEEHFYLKMIISTEIFVEKTFFLKEIYSPISLKDPRGIKRRSNNPAAADWTTYLLKCRFDNPNYKKPA